MWWWKAALHLDEAQRALANAMAHNVDDPRPIHALYDRLREGQAILLEIFRAKGLLPGSGMSNGTGTVEVPMPGMPEPEMPELAVVAIVTAAALSSGPVPTIAADAVVVAGTAETMTAEVPHPIDASSSWGFTVEAPAVSEVDQVAAASESERSAVVPSPDPVIPAIVLEESTVSPSPDPTSGSVRG